MKKSFVIFSTCVFNIILTFLLANFLSIYHFGSVPTLLTLIYLLSIFSIFEYIMLSIVYIVSKKLKKEKIGYKKIIKIVFYFIFLLSILCFIFATEIDWINYHSNGYSAPFHLYVIENAITILIPPILLIVICAFLFRRKK